MDTPIIRVRDIMATDFIVVDGKRTVAEVLGLIKDSPSRGIIIDKRDEDDEYGLVLLSDIARKVLARDRSPERVNVYEIMCKPAIAVAPSMNIRYCARLFDQFDIHRAPVLEDSKVIGMVSYNDIIMKGLVRLHDGGKD